MARLGEIPHFLVVTLMQLNVALLGYPLGSYKLISQTMFDNLLVYISEIATRHLRLPNDHS